MGDDRLSDVLARRGVLAPAEVVTLVVALALDLAEMHAAGRAHGCVCAQMVRFDPDGRPRLIGVGSPADAAGCRGDVRDLAALGLLALPDRPPAALVEALDAGLADSCDPTELAERVLASGPAAPLRLPRRHQQPANVVEPRPSTSSARRRLALLAVIVGAVGFWLRPAGPAPDRWDDVLARLDHARLAAITDRSQRELRAVYAPESAPLARDAALIQRLTRRRMVLSGKLAMLTQARQLSRTTNSATLDVVEQPATYVLLDAQGRAVLRVVGHARHVVVHLRREPAGWRVTSVD